MDEDEFNIAVRKFLKEVGVTSQREIEKAVREALAAGTIDGTAALEATMTLDVPQLRLRHVVQRTIELE
jgi:hypothetical protein